jgi:Zn-dependent protease
MTLQLIRLRGVPVEVHWSLLLLVILFVRGLTLVLFPSRYPELGGGAYALMGLAAAIAFVCCILLHELGHTVQGVREGAVVDRITLWFFGGVAWLSHPATTPAADARVTLAGPAVSAALAAAFGLLAWLADALGGGDAIVGVPLWLAQINAALLALNLIPAFPLDGGRLLAAWLWHRRGSRLGAIRASCRIGQVAAGLTIAFGALAPFFGVLPAALRADAAIDGLTVMFFGGLALYLSLQAEEHADRL